MELTLRTLELTDGKVNQHRDEVSLVKGVCEIGIGNELLALKCMVIMMQGEPECLSFFMYKETLEEFLKHIVDLTDDYANIKAIREEAIKLVNAYGRRQIDDLKPYYDLLVKK